MERMVDEIRVSLPQLGLGNRKRSICRPVSLLRRILTRLTIEATFHYVYGLHTLSYFLEISAAKNQSFFLYKCEGKYIDSHGW